MAASPFGFSTKFTDTETGLVCYGYRWYWPELGRWMNRDLIEERGGFNLYGMIGNDPVDRVDVLGLLAQSSLQQGPAVGGAAAANAARAAAEAYKLARLETWTSVGIASAFTLAGLQPESPTKTGIQKAVEDYNFDCPCVSASFYGRPDSKNRPTGVLASYSMISPPVLDTRKLPSSISGWNEARPLYELHQIHRTHILANSLGGKNVYENLVTAMGSANNSEMQRVENKIRKFAREHTSVCMLFRASYRTYKEGDALAPKMLIINIVTSRDGGNRQQYHTVVTFPDLLGYEAAGGFFGLGVARIFPLN